MPRAYRAWTTLEFERLSRLAAAGWRDREIAELVGRTVESVRQRRRRLQGKIRRGK